TRSSDAIPALVSLLGRPSALVRLHAAWALAQIDSPIARAALDSQRVTETDPSVLDEIASGELSHADQP
ncbi:MAG: hypothetical protein JWO36_7022, partial [Myxococcales bacterium]|nr:hypothetical protein [Myxococcales bacterium]